MRVAMTVNGTGQDHDVEPRTLLVQYLREACGLTGTKVGCDTSSCGACTVLVDGESVKSCTMLAAQADGASITTIEGLASGRRRCTRCSRRSTSSTGCSAGSAPRAWCSPRSRCSRRTRTRPSARSASGSKATSAAAPATTTSCVRCSPPARGRRVIPAAFDYARADSTDAAVGTAHRARRRSEADRRRHVVAAADEAAARGAERPHRRRSARRALVRPRRRRPLAIGALTRHRDLETSAVLRDGCGMLRAVAAEVGDNQVRHRGTIGGSVAHGDPASDLPAALLALDATFVARGPDGEREIAADDFFAGFLETALAPDELLTEIRVPKTGANGFSYQKFNRRAQDYAIVGALAVQVDGASRVALVNMGTDAAAGRRRRSRARRRRVGRRGRGARGRGHRAVRATSTRASSTGSSSPVSSPVARSRPRALDHDRGRRPRGRPRLTRRRRR